MKLSNAERILAVTLVAYVVCDILLTPPAHLETRDPALVTGLGIVTLVLLFIGLALSVVALVLLFRRSRRTPIVAIVRALLYFPAPLVELIQVVVALIVIRAGFWVLRRGET